MTSAWCTSILLASVVWGIGESSVTQEHDCNAAPVIEGGTGVLAFFLRKDINMSSDDVFANLRRASDLGNVCTVEGLYSAQCSMTWNVVTCKDVDSDIVWCFRQELAVKCSSVDARYQTDGLVNNSITLSILNATREFEDTYILRVYVNNKAEDTINCSLEVIASTVPTPNDDAGTIDDVVLIAAVAGSLGTLFIVLVVIASVFCVRKVRSSMTKKDGTSSNETEKPLILMHVPEIKKRSEKAADAFLPQTTPSTASDVMGTSSQRIEANHTPEQDAFRRRKGGTSEVESSQRIEANHTPEQDAFRRRKGGTSEVESIDNDNYKSTKSPPALQAKHNVEKQRDLASEPWYFGNIRSEQAGKLLLAAKNGEGSFLVMDSNGKPDKYILKVKFNGQVKSRMICVSPSGFWIESHNHFPTVTSLIDYYREHAGCFPTNLTLPCVRTSNIP